MKLKANGIYVGYFSDIFKYFGIIKPTVIASIIAVTMLAIDEKDIIRADWNWLVFLVIIMTINILAIIIGGVYRLIKLPYVSYLDVMLEACILSSLMYVMGLLLWRKLASYKIIIVVIVEVALIIVLLMRLRYYCANKDNNRSFTVLDLKDVFENELDNVPFPLFLSDCDVNYDLLGRTATIQKLYNVIMNCNTEKCFIIGLEGKWGSGKTTIIRNTIKRIQEDAKKTIVIDDYRPWIYETEQGILDGFLDNLCRKISGIEGVVALRRNVSAITRSVIRTAYNKNTLTDTLDFIHNGYEANKERINYLTSHCGQRIIVLIDDFDRMDADKIVFTLKMINQIINFDNIVFVLSYDRYVLGKLLEDQKTIDSSYLKKIVQMTIKVPQMDKAIFNPLMCKTLKNIASKSDIMLKDEDFQAIKDGLSVINDLRDFKIFVNSVFVPTLALGGNLWPRDEILLGMIRIINDDLYDCIYYNKDIFVSQDFMFSGEYRYEDNAAKEKRITAFFDSLFKNEKNQKCEIILSTLFPRVNCYMKKIGSSVGYDEYSDDTISVNGGIASGKYIDLYFTEGDNEYTLGKGAAQKCVSLLQDEVESFDSEFEKMVRMLDVISQKAFLRSMELMLSRLTNCQKNKLAQTLYKQVFMFGNKNRFDYSDAQGIVISLIAETIMYIDETQLNEFIEEAIAYNDRILVLAEVERKMRKKSNDSLLEKCQNAQIFSQRVHEFVDDLMKNNINLYSEKYYHYQNIHGVYMLATNKNEFKKYLMGLMNEKNVFLILRDALEKMSNRDDTYRYYYSEEIVNNWFNTKKVESILEKVEPNDERDRIMLSAYNRYNLKKGMHVEKNYVSSNVEIV